MCLAVQLLLDDDAMLPFDGMVIATGAPARPLPGDGDVFALRSLTEASRLRDEIIRAATILIVSDGPLATEIASASAAMGITTTIIQRLAGWSRPGTAQM
jgi:NADPH-dependent 2,4-dienoyl-CoA reductase/sulfur reductase-like enzyme